MALRASIEQRISQSHERKTNSDFAVKPLLEILELLFFIALDTLSIHVRSEKLKAFFPNALSVTWMTA